MQLHACQRAGQQAVEAARAYVGLGRDAYEVLISRSMSDVTQFGEIRHCPCAAVQHGWRTHGKGSCKDFRRSLEATAVA